jgi:hypothetical protein
VRAGILFSKLQGAEGEIWIGKSARVGSIEKWTALPSESSPGSWEFAAEITERDEYLITQAPDTVRLAFGPTKQLRWTGVLEIAGDRVRGTFVGSPEER